MGKVTSTAQHGGQHGTALQCRQPALSQPVQAASPQPPIILAPMAGSVPAVSHSILHRSTLPPLTACLHAACAAPFGTAVLQTKIVRDDGVAGLFRGGGPTVVRAMALNMGMLASNDQAKEMIEAAGFTKGGSVAVLGGATIAGGCCWLGWVWIDHTRVTGRAGRASDRTCKGLQALLAMIVCQASCAG